MSMQALSWHVIQTKVLPFSGAALSGSETGMEVGVALYFANAASDAARSSLALADPLSESPEELHAVKTPHIMSNAINAATTPLRWWFIRFPSDFLMLREDPTGAGADPRTLCKTVARRGKDLV